LKCEEMKEARQGRSAVGEERVKVGGGGGSAAGAVGKERLKGGV
jgi:hypothetical protein